MQLSLPLISILILFVFSIAMLIVHLLAPKFIYSWLIAALGAVIVWPMFLIARSNMPQAIPLKFWAIPGLAIAPPVLLLDDISWPFAFSIVTLALTKILTDAVRADDTDWSSWTISLLFSGVGLIAVMAGNPLALLLAWAVLDIAEFCIFLWKVKSDAQLRQGVVNLAIRMIGISLLLWALVSAQGLHGWLSFADVSPRLGTYLLLAAWFHLGIFPIALLSENASSVQHSDELLLRLITAASSFVLLARTASIGILSWQLPYLYAFATICVLYAGFFWLVSRNEVAGQPFWILGLASISMFAVARALPGAALAWGSAALLSGGLLFLFSARNRLLLIFPVIGLISFLGLPFSLTWNGSSLFTPPFSPVSIILLVTQVLFAAGYIRIAIHDQESSLPAERLGWIVYSWGLLLLTGSLIMVIWWETSFQGKIITPINLLSLLPGIIVTGLTGVMVFLGRRGWDLSDRGRSIFASIFNFHWLVEILSAIFHFVERALAFFSIILEGEGGILWALLWIVLFLTFLSQTILGGL